LQQILSASRLRQRDQIEKVGLAANPDPGYDSNPQNTQPLSLLAEMSICVGNYFRICCYRTYNKTGCAEVPGERTPKVGIKSALRRFKG